MGDVNQFNIVASKMNINVVTNEGAEFMLHLVFKTHRLNAYVNDP